MPVETRKWRVARCAAVATAICGSAPAAAAPALPQDPRLAPVQGALVELVERTADAGLPAELVVSKVKEGLAKDAPAPAIRLAAEQLARHLADADAFLAARGHPARTPALLRALAEARRARVELSRAEALLRPDATPEATAHAVEVLTDLAQRGYPTDRALVVVARVLEREPRALGQIASGVELLRRDHALEPGQALDRVARELAGGAPLAAAVTRAVEAEWSAARGAGLRGTRRSKLDPGHQGGAGRSKGKMK